MEIYEKLKVKETKSKLSWLIDHYAEELSEGKGLEVGLVCEHFAEKTISGMNDSIRLALCHRKEAYFYDMFLQYDRMYHFLVDQKLVRIRNIPYPEMPLEFLRLLLKTGLNRTDFRRCDENVIHAMYDCIGESLYMYYQGLLYEFYCNTKDKEVESRLRVSVNELFNCFQKNGTKMYLYDSEHIDNEISFRFQEALEKADLSENYCKRMAHTLEVLSSIQ